MRMHCAGGTLEVGVKAHEGIEDRPRVRGPLIYSGSVDGRIIEQRRDPAVTAAFAAYGAASVANSPRVGPRASVELLGDR